MKLTFDFVARKKGALGRRSRYQATTQGLNTKECFLALYNTYEHIAAPEVVKAGVRFGFDVENYRAKATFTYSHFGYEKAVTDTGTVAFFSLYPNGQLVWVPAVKIAQLECLRKGD